MVLREWLPDVLHHVEPFVSEEDIAKGQRGLEVIRGQLEGATAGIICLTPENADAPWILFEAGALSNSIGAKDLLCPLLIGMRKADVKSPLSQFQLTSPDRTDVFRLVSSINASFDSTLRASDADLGRRFGRLWPELKSALHEQMKADSASDLPVQRTEQDVMLEILDIVREMRRGQSVPVSEREFGFGLGSGQNTWPPEHSFVPGDKVRHKSFGLGKVIAIEGVGQRETATVNFKSVGMKKLKTAFARLELLDDTDSAEAAA